MICQRIGRPPISTIGFGLTVVSSEIRLPKPPANNTTFIHPPENAYGLYVKHVWSCNDSSGASAFWIGPPSCLRLPRSIEKSTAADERADRFVRSQANATMGIAKAGKAG